MKSASPVSTTPLPSTAAWDTELARLEVSFEVVIQSAMKRMLIIVDMLPEKRQLMRSSVLDELNGILRYQLGEFERVRKLGSVPGEESSGSRQS